MIIRFILCISLIGICKGGIMNNFLHDEIPKCSDVLDKVTTRRVKVNNPPDLKGKWVSTRCETRPGPQYVTRSYEFQKNLNFKLMLHMYQDRHCARPSATFVARGKLVLGANSWVTSGGIQAEYIVNKLTLVPHSKRNADKFAKVISKSCPDNESLRILKPHRPVTIMSYFENLNEVSKNYDCSDGFGIYWHELQLIRIEEFRDPKSPRLNPKFLKHLYLGDLHTNRTKQKEYRPTAYQMPLVHSEKIHNCGICQAVFRSTEKTPPHLHINPELPLLLSGSWVSSKCEVQRYGMFLTRLLTFSHMTNKWQFEQRYYKDPLCRYPAYTLDASGYYKQAGQENPASYTSYIYDSGITTKMKPKEVQDISDVYKNDPNDLISESSVNISHIMNEIDYNSEFPVSMGVVPANSPLIQDMNAEARLQKENFGYDLMVEDLIITPHDYGVVSQLNVIRGGKCGLPGTWKLGEKQDVTNTNGCIPMGIKVPSLEEEILKNEMNNYGNLELYLGQIPTTNHGFLDHTPRPTSWAPPLMQCHYTPHYDEHDNELLPMVGARIAFNSATKYDGHFIKSFSLLFFALHLVLS